MTGLKEMLLQQARENFSIIPAEFFEKFRDVRITAVMLSHGRFDQTVASVQALYDNVLIPFKLLVIDNNSGDEIQDKLKESLSTRDSTKLILLKKNLGCAGGRAYSLAHVATEYVMFLDNDVEVFPGTIEHLLFSLESDPKLVASAGNVIFPDGRVHLCGGDYMEKDDVLSYVLLGADRQFDDPSIGASGLCKWVNGGSTVFRRAIFEKYPYLQMGYFEDLEWCYRLNLGGEGRFYRSVEAVVLHHHRPRFRNLPEAELERLQYFVQYIVAIAYFYKTHKIIIRDLSDFIPDLQPIDDRHNIASAKLVLEAIDLYGIEWFLNKWNDSGVALLPLRVMGEMTERLTGQDPSGIDLLRECPPGLFRLCHDLLAGAILRKDGRIADLEAGNARMEELEMTVSEKESRIRGLKSALTDADEALTDADVALTDAERALTDAGRALTDAGHALTDTDYVLTDAEHALQALEYKIQAQEDQIAGRNIEIERLKKIENSLSWRAIKRFLNLVDQKLFPTNTKRGNAYLKLRELICPRPAEIGADAAHLATREGKADEQPPGLFIKLHCDNATSILSALEVSGWAVSSHGIDRVEIYHNGTLAGLASYGRPRPDVQAAHPSVLHSGESGFFFFSTLEKAPLIGSVSTILIRAVDKHRQRAETTRSIEHKDPYQTYVKKTQLSEATLRWMKRVSNDFSRKPFISLAVAVSADTFPMLNRSLDSIRAQAYPFWEVILFCEKECGTDVKKDIETLTGEGDIKVCSRTECNELSHKAKGEFIAFLSSGGLLAPHALFEIVKGMNAGETADLIYTDEDRLADGERKDPFFKPDWSPDLLRSMNYIGQFFLLEKRVFDAAGGLDRGFTEEGLYDLLLRVVEQTGKIAHVPLALYTKAVKTQHLPQAGRAALEAALLRRDIGGEVIPLERAGTYRVKRKVIGSPLVSIIILTAYKNPDLIEGCIRSIVEKSTYADYEIIIVDNAHGKLDRQHVERLVPASKLTIIEYDKSFNFSLMNNLAAARAKGDHLILLNDDTEVIAPEWIEAMLEHSQGPDVGVVGAKLLYDNDTVQHAGVFLVDYGGGARHAFRYEHSDSAGYQGLLRVTRNCSAITFACVMIRKEVFLRVGGLEENLTIECNDVDFCLRVIDAGYRVVWTPFACLYHKELTSRVKTNILEDVDFFWKRWRKLLESGDPFYNPNLTLEQDNFCVGSRPVITGHHEPSPLGNELVQYDGPRLTDAGHVKKILLIKLDHLGDVILSLPAIRMIRETFPGARITVLAANWSRSILEKVDYIDEILSFDYFHERTAEGPRDLSDEDRGHLKEMLQRANYDLAVDLRKHPDTREVLRLSGARYTAGYSTGSDDSWLSICLRQAREMEDIPRELHKPHMSAQLCKLIECITDRDLRVSDYFNVSLDVSSDRITSDVVRDCFQTADDLLTVGIHPGAGLVVKQWSAAHFARLADLIVERKDARVIIFGGKDDEMIASDICERVGRKDKVTVLAGKTSLSEFMMLVKMCGIFIGNDSGPTHIAGILGVPTVAVFGGHVSPHEWHPLGQRTLSVRLDLPCSPCYKPFPQQCPHDMKCLKFLWPEKVFDAVCQLMTISGKLRRNISKVEAV